jgi:hypothetical protein
MTLSLQVADFAPELTFDTSSGTGDPLAFSGPLVETPGQIIFDNQSNVAVKVTTDAAGLNGKTFAASQAIILDMPTNRTADSTTFTFAKGTQFYASSSSGTGIFYISYTYAKR